MSGTPEEITHCADPDCAGLHPCEAKLPINYSWPRSLNPSSVVVWQQICDQVGTELWRYACIHEHVVEGYTCLVHRPVSRQVGCKTCWDLGHECPLTAELVVAR